MNHNQTKILFFLQVIGHPRDSKRIKMLQDQGFYVEAIAFERDYHKGRQPTCKIKSLGKIQHRKYFDRLIKFISVIPFIRKQIKSCDIIYTSGQDLALLTLFAGILLNKPIVVEVGDLVPLQVSSSITSKIFRKFDGWITSKYSLLVVISEGFLSSYYRSWLGVKIPGIVIQNKLEIKNSNHCEIASNTSDKECTALLERPLKIGYFGLLRDMWSWLVLSSLSEQYASKFEIVLAGLPVNPKNIAEKIEKYPNITYLGEYSSPKDLPKIYNQIDMVWACYSEINKDDWNLRWGRPNRFYESCYFKKPCFARAGSLFAEDVEKYKIGILIEEVSVQTVVEQIAKIKLSDILTMKKSMNNLSEDVYLLTNEHQLLANEINKLLT